MPKLKVMIPEAGEVTHELVDELITLGRVSDNMIQVEDSSVSSRHAQLALAGNGNYKLQDLGSTNGTQVNGASITDVTLHHGDRVRFGQVEAAYYSGNVAPVAEPLPTADEPVAQPAAETHRPSNFTNASPFEKKSREKDPTSLYIMIFAGVALLAFIAALALIFTLQPPVLPPAP